MTLWYEKIGFKTKKAEEKLNYLSENETIRLNNVLEGKSKKKMIIAVLRMLC